MHTASNNLIRLLCATAAIILLAAGLNYVVDPLQLFRPARLFAAMYSPDSRMQDAGLIRSQAFDTAFMGTSLALPFRQSEIDKALDVRSLKLAMSGSTSKEQSFVLTAAFERRPKRVLWQMDDWIFRNAPDVDSEAYFPADFYRRNARGVASYLFSGAMARESLWILLRSIPPLQPIVAKLTNTVVFKFPIANVDDINALRPDFDIAGFYNAKNAMAAFIRITDPGRRVFLAEGYNYDAMVRNFERDAIGLIERNPDVTFDIYFAPYSILHFVAMRDASPSTLRITYDFTAYAFSRLTKYSNVRLHDFRDVEAITHDLNNYGDVMHQSPVAGQKILQMLGERKYVVEPAAPLASLERLKAQVEAYRLER